MSTTNTRSVEEEIEFQTRRQGVLGGSDFPILFGFDPKRNALDLYHQKTRPIDEAEVRREVEEEHSIDLYRGNRLEKEAARDFFRFTEFQRGRHETRQISHPDYEDIAVHVDGTIYADDSREPPRDQTGVLEIKSPRASVFQALVDQGVSRRYIVQLHANCAVTRRAWGVWGFYCLHHDAGPVLPVAVNYDEEFGRMLLERGEEFMRHHVAERIPPDPDDWDVAGSGDADELLDRSGEYKTLRADEFSEAVRLAETYFERKAIADLAEERYDEAKARLRSWIEDNLDTDAVQVPVPDTEGDVFDKIRIIRKEGGSYVRTSQIEDHRPIDRDAFIRALREGVIEVNREATETGTIAEVLKRLELDLDRFRYDKSKSVFLQSWPKGNLRERFDLTD